MEEKIRNISLSFFFQLIRFLFTKVTDMALASDLTKFTFDGVHPICVEGRFLKARLAQSNTNLIIEEYGLDVKSSEKCPCLYREFSIPAPNDVFNSNGRDRIIGNPLCIGTHKQFIILQYATTLCQYIKFLVVDTERSIVRPCQMISRQFLREYILKAPLECYLDTDSPTCLVRLPPAMLLSQRSFELQTVLFNRSNDTENYIPVGNIMLGFDRFDDIVSVKNTCYLNILPVEIGKVLLISVNSFCTKLTFEALDTATLRTTELTTKSTEVSYECCCLHTRACKTRAGDLLCVACLTVGKIDDFTVVWRLHVFTFDGITHENVSKQCHDVTKWFTPVEKPLDKGSGEMMLTISKSDTMLEVWHVYRHSRIKLILEIRLARKQVPCLKSVCRSVILQHTNQWDLPKLGTLPSSLKDYLQFE